MPLSVRTPGDIDLEKTFCINYHSITRPVPPTHSQGPGTIVLGKELSMHHHLDPFAAGPAAQACSRPRDHPVSGIILSSQRLKGLWQPSRPRIAALTHPDPPATARGSYCSGEKMFDASSSESPRGLLPICFSRPLRVPPTLSFLTASRPIRSQGWLQRNSYPDRGSSTGNPTQSCAPPALYAVF
jgi:hypothetical protein